MAIRIVTGLNGAGKTSNELWRFLKDKEFEGRPKFATPIKDFDPVAHGVGSLENLEKWQELPEGSVIFVDEVQRYLPTRGSGKAPPQWIEKFAEHRHLGFDFIMTTPNVMMVDPYVRRLGNPHVHYVRPWNAKVSSRWTFESVQSDPLSGSARAAGVRETVKANKEVFSLYTSTVLDTHKGRFPAKMAYIIAGAAVAIVFGFWATVHGLKSRNAAQVHAAQAKYGVPSGVAGSGSALAKGGGGGSYGGGRAGWDAAGVTPRIKNMPWTAPIYDNLTAPVDFPRIAACIMSPSHPCSCVTQQATPLDIDKGTCEGIVHHGAFDPWLNSDKAELNEQGGQAHVTVPDQRSDQRVAFNVDRSPGGGRPESFDVEESRDLAETRPIPHTPWEQYGLPGVTAPRQ